MGRGDHPNSRANLKKAYNGKGGFDTETARKAKIESDKSKRVNGMLSANLKEQLDEDTIKELNQKIIGMAKKGNLKAYEIIRDGIGEKPNDKVDLNIEDESARAADEYFTARYNRRSDK